METNPQTKELKMARTKQEIQAEVDQLKKKIKSGKLKGEAHSKAVRRKCNLEFALRNYGKKRTRKPKQKAIEKGQGFLPSFLGQMNMVRVEELVADKIFNEIKHELVADTSKSKASGE